MNYDSAECTKKVEDIFSSHGGIVNGAKVTCLEVTAGTRTWYILVDFSEVRDAVAHILRCGACPDYRHPSGSCGTMLSSSSWKGRVDVVFIIHASISFENGSVYEE